MRRRLGSEDNHSNDYYNRIRLQQERTMVKFSAVSLSAILAAAIGANAQIRTITKPIRQEVITGSLMKHAKPYRKSNSHHRRLEEEDKLAIDGTYSIKFSSCLDIKTYDANLFDDDMIQYVQSGRVVSTKSYVLFHACQDADCDDDDELYIVDLPTYLTSIVEYKAEEMENYCRACEEAEDTCVGDDDSNDDGGAANYTDDGGANRKLSLQRKTTEVNCDQCQAYGCYDEDGDQDQEEDKTDERVAEWITKLAECERFEDEDAQWNGLELFYGAICNADGDGIEFVPFLDEDCTMYAKPLTFSSYYNATYEEEDGVWIDYASYAETYIAEALGSAMSCSEYQAPQGYDGYGDDDGEEEAEVNEYCKKLFEESAFSLNTCNATAEDKDEEYNDDDGFSWYSFDMTMESTDEIEVVCTKVKELNGEYYHAYHAPSSYSASIYNVVARSTSNEWSSLSSFEMSAFEIVLFTAAMLAFAICWCRRRMQKCNEPDLETTLV